MLHKTFGERIFEGFNGFLLLVIAAAMLFPFLYIFSVSFSSYAEFVAKDIILWPSDWDLGAYKYVLASKSFLRALWFSVYITALGTAINLFFSTTMAYALTYRFIGQKAMLIFIIITLLFSPGIIPTYLTVKAFGMIDSIWALIIPAAISPFNLIVIRAFFQNVPAELSEAAIMDGANPLHIFTKVFLPLSKPVLATFGLFYAVGHWNSYFAAIIYINDPAKWPIQVVLRQLVIVNRPNMASISTTTGMMDQLPPAETVQMAAILLATLPILIVYPFLQKHFAKGVMLGAVKG